MASQVVEKLNSHSLNESQLALLRPLHQRGAHETKRQRLRRALALERAGVADNAAAPNTELYRQRKHSRGGGGGDDGGAAGSDSGSDSGDDGSQVCMTMV
jgi:hypothetical protein